MTDNFSRGSAKIYQFPARTRTTPGGDREEVKDAADLRSPRISGMAVGSGWYHDAAIQESRRPRER
jgi:hypothetical protein